MKVYNYPANLDEDSDHDRAMSRLQFLQEAFNTDIDGNGKLKMNSESVKSMETVKEI